MRSDGSETRRLMDDGFKDRGASWSPDGKSGIVSSISTRTVWGVDPSRVNDLPSVEMMKDVADAGLLDVQSWAPSGTLIAGSYYPTPLTIIPAVWDLAAKTLRTLDIPPAPDLGGSSAFLPDSRRLLVGSGGALMLVDLAGGPPRLLREDSPGDSYLLSRDGRTLVHEHPVFESDIWLMEMADAGR